MEKKIGPFSLYEKKPNDICYGSIYTCEVDLPVPFFSRRTIRVYLPEDFDPNKIYPLMVMSDGQNMVDKYTTTFGAWELDKRQHELLAQGHKSFIIVGIDCAPELAERAFEYSFPHMRIKNWEKGNYRENAEKDIYSHLLYEYIVKQLLPFARQYFPITSERKDTCVCGASMGGVFALSLICLFPDVFGTALCFSPGYFLYDEEELRKFLEDKVPGIDKDHKLYFYTGDKEFEKQFVEPTKKMYDYFVNKGFGSNVKYVFAPGAEHSEKYWTLFANDAIKFWQS